MSRYRTDLHPRHGVALELVCTDCSTAVLTVAAGECELRLLERAADTHDRAAHMTATPDLSEDYPTLYYHSVRGTCEDPSCIMSACQVTREARRALAELAGLRKDVANLLTWKAEASQVLERWDDVWRAAGEPGPLGRFKSDNVKRVLEENGRDLAFLRRNLIAVEHALQEANRSRQYLRTLLDRSR